MISRPLKKQFGKSPLAEKEVIEEKARMIAQGYARRKRKSKKSRARPAVKKKIVEVELEA